MSASIDHRALEWLASGDTGISSLAIMLWLSGRVKETEEWSTTPRDPSDLGRCLRLLDRVPEWQPRMVEMVDAGGLWPAFSARWAEMEAAFISECGGKLPERGDHWNCPKTYKLMREVEKQAFEARGEA